MVMRGPTSGNITAKLGNSTKLVKGQEDCEKPQPSLQWTCVSVEVREALSLPEGKPREDKEQLLPAGNSGSKSRLVGPPHTHIIHRAL